MVTAVPYLFYKMIYYSKDLPFGSLFTKLNSAQSQWKETEISDVFYQLIHLIIILLNKAIKAKL